MTSKKFTISMIALALLGSAGFGGAGAFAATNSTSTTSTASNQATTKPTASSQTATKSSNARHGHHGMHGHHRFMGGVDAKALAADLHITAKTLRADLRAGQSLNQIATAQGVSNSTLLSDAQALVAARLAKAEASGHLTATQVTAIGQKIDAKLPTLLAHTFKPDAHKTGAHRHGFAGGPMDLVKGLASDLKLPAKTLRADLRAGQSLNQIATAQGVSSSTLLSDAQALVAARLAKAEASGHLTATQVTTIGQKIDAKLPNVLNHVFKAKNPTVNATTTTSTAVGSTTNA